MYTRELLLRLPELETMRGKIDARVPEEWVHFLEAKYGDKTTAIRHLIRQEIARDGHIPKSLHRRQIVVSVEELPSESMERRVGEQILLAAHGFKVALADNKRIDYGAETDSITGPMAKTCHILINRQESFIGRAA